MLLVVSKLFCLPKRTVTVKTVVRGQVPRYIRALGPIKKYASPIKDDS